MNEHGALPCAGGNSTFCSLSCLAFSTRAAAHLFWRSLFRPDSTRTRSRTCSAALSSASSPVPAATAASMAATNPFAASASARAWDASRSAANSLRATCAHAHAHARGTTRETRTPQETYGLLQGHAVVMQF
jgi:hypothetical protein